MAIAGAKEKIHVALQDWPGITSQPHRFGGIEYCLGRREVGHVHGDSLVDIPFPKKVAMNWLQLAAPNPTTSFPRAAGSAFT
jgi:hypothetical protein